VVCGDASAHRGVQAGGGMSGALQRGLLVAALVVGSAAASAQPRYSFEQTRTLLPKTVVPSHYGLALQLDPARDRFDGEVTIRVRVSQAVPAIVLHARDLDAQQATLGSGKAARALRVVADAKRHTWRLVPRDGRPIAAGEQRLVLRYRGRVQAAGQGLYRAKHRVDGKPAVMLATQLEAVNARMVFPGFDEPIFRAAFDLQVTAPRQYEVLANQPRTQRTVQGRNVRHRFATTPPMPSYLFAVTVGRFDVLQSESKGDGAGVPLRIVTAPGKREQGRYAMSVTQQVLPYYNSYFGTPYALPKLDQLAVPGTRDGAMEDWGLISYVENALLYDPARSSPRTERRVFGVIAHEIAHQWFGNLVSVSSWDEIWLNEAFATWMDTKAAERFHPEWQAQLSARGWLDETMERDATAATRAIRSGPVDEARVFEVFDGITYAKGGAVLSMLEQWVGDEAFQRGLAAYMQERRMAPATAGDLWHHVGQAVGRPVGAVAATWTDQPGFPLVEASTACVDGRTAVTLRQRRFLMSAGANAGDATQWQVPVRLARDTALETVLLDAPERRFELPGCGDAALVVNAGGRGFYRVRYSDAMQARLVERFASLPAADRVALVADSFALAQAGVQPLSRHFEWLAQLPRVTDSGRAPLYALAKTQLVALDETLAGTPAAAAVRTAARALLAPELARLGWQVPASEDAEVTRLRGELIGALAHFDDNAVVAASRERFAAALAPRGEQPSSLPPSLRSAVIGAVGRHADQREFDALWSALRNTDSMEDRWVYVSALAATRDAARAKQVLGLALAEWLPPNVATDVPGIVARTPEHGAAAYAFSVEQWARLSRRAGAGVFGERAWLLPSAAGAFHDRAAAARLREDQKRLAGPTGVGPADQMATRIELRAALRERESERLGTALAAWQPAR
jgi:aminopeptidase N